MWTKKERLKFLFQSHHMEFSTVMGICAADLRGESSVGASWSGVFCQGQPRYHCEGLSTGPAVGVRRVLASVCCGSVSVCPQEGHCVQLSWKAPPHLLCPWDSAALSPLPCPHSGQYPTLTVPGAHLCAWISYCFLQALP